jgi:hypothetical protein
LRGVVTTEAETATADLEQAGAAGLEHLQAATTTNPQFGHAANPGGLTGDFGNLRPVAAA